MGLLIVSVAWASGTGSKKAPSLMEQQDPSIDIEPLVVESAGPISGFKFNEGKDAYAASKYKTPCGGDLYEGHSHRYINGNVSECAHLCVNCFECAGFINHIEEGRCSFLSSISVAEPAEGSVLDTYEVSTPEAQTRCSHVTTRASCRCAKKAQLRLQMAWSVQHVPQGKFPLREGRAILA